jgi:hypothetical protein
VLLKVEHIYPRPAQVTGCSMGFASSGVRWTINHERGIRLRLAITAGHYRINHSWNTWRVRLEYFAADSLKFSCRYYLRTTPVPFPGRNLSAEVTSMVLIPHDLLVSKYRDALIKAGKQPPTEAEIEQLCRDVEEAIITRERALHGSTTAQSPVPAVKVVFAPRIASDHDAVKLLDAAGARGARAAFKPRALPGRQ